MPSFIAPPNITSDTDLTFRLTVKDDKNISSTDDAMVTINHIIAGNKSPVGYAGTDQTVNANSMVYLDSSKSKDPDGDKIISYSWKQISGPAVTLNNSNTANPSFKAPNVSTDTDLKFSLMVKDDKESTGNPVFVTITVKHINHNPTANAEKNQTVTPGYVVSLDGTGSKDPDGDPLSYSWVQVDGPSVKIDDSKTAVVTFTAPKDISSDTDMIFELTVRDSKNATSKDSVKVTVKYIPPPNQPPVANAGPDQTVNSGDNVTLDGSGSTDSDGKIVSYSWKQISGPYYNAKQCKFCKINIHSSNCFI